MLGNHQIIDSNSGGPGEDGEPTGMTHIQPRILSFVWKKTLGLCSTLILFPMSLERKSRIIM